jgi:hypothetical protein
MVVDPSGSPQMAEPAGVDLNRVLTHAVPMKRGLALSAVGSVAALTVAVLVVVRQPGAKRGRLVGLIV